MDNAFIKLILEEEFRSLPDQAPLEHFVHHNNLHHYEDEPFEIAVEKCYLDYGRSPYMGLSYYRGKMSCSEISPHFFAKRLRDAGFDILDENLLDYIKTRLHTFHDTGELKFLKDEEMLFDKNFEKTVSFDEKAKSLWQTIDGVDAKSDHITYPDYHINNSLRVVNKILVPFLSVMLDQGQAYEQLSQKERKNVWESFYRYLSSSLSQRKYDRAFRYYKQASEDSVLFVLDYLSNASSDEEALRWSIRDLLYVLPGWAGMVYKVSRNKEVIPRRDVDISIYDYMAMRIILSHALKLKSDTIHSPIATNFQIKTNVFYCLYYYNVLKTPLELFELFNKLNRLILRRVFQQAYEDTYQSLILSGLSKTKIAEKINAKFQMFFCIDDREESMRRYLEEVSTEVETYGVAGFFGLDMMFQAVNSPRPRRFCPPAATPKYIIDEVGEGKQFALAPLFHDGRHDFISSTFFNFILGPLRALELKWHLFFPRTKRKISDYLKSTKVETIRYQRSLDSSAQEVPIKGYNLDESAAKVAGILKGAGLVNHFAPYVIMIGHGHDSFNNPHVAAYRCGACSGANASPNAKIFAKMANDPEVRKILAQTHGVMIPETTLFVGGYHDTCNDRVDLFGIDKMRSEDFKQLQSILLEARQLNAKERCQRFFQESNKLTPNKALKIVEERAWKVAEPRPELNHATNALCVVGRRGLSKGLFLDRKAFLVSYDSEIDATNDILTGLLSAVIPVCAGINLEYYFSKVDTENYGSGSKTSHNVTGLFGVMNGIRGDLRTGLVWQMVEYHDPLRILFIIEASEDAIFDVMGRNEEVKNLIQNHWISLAIVERDNPENLKLYRNGVFHPFEREDQLVFKQYQSSSEVKSELGKPTHFAYIGDSRHG